MDKNDKLAHSRKKLKKYREKMAAKSSEKPKIPMNDEVEMSSQDSPFLSLQLPRVESTVPHTSSLSHPHQSLPSSMHFNGPSGPQEHVVQRLQEEDRDVEQRERDKREREFLEEQIKAHAQTVDILVSEKSSLQKEMSSLASKLNESQEAYASSQLYLQSARNRQTELEREKDSLEDKAASVEKELRHLMVQNSQLLSEAALLRSTADDVEQQKEELISKLRLQQAEYQQVQQRCSQLEVQLMQKGVMDSTNTEGWSLDDLKKWKEECDKLNDAVQRMRVDREDLLKQVSALKDQQNREKQDLEASLVQVQSESRAKERRIEELESLLSRAKDEQVSSAESMSLDHSLILENVQGRLKEAEDEKAHYSQQLQEQMSTNLVLNQTISEQQSRIESLEERISRLSSDTVDQKTLLDTLQQDKEALSRSVLQNKELKAQLSELEGEFIKMSHKNMEYASELESEKYAKKTLQEAVNKQSVEMLELSSQLQRLQQELEERKIEGEQRERHKTEGNTVAEEMFRGSGQETIVGRSTEDDEMMKQTLRNLEMERNTLATQLQAALMEREDLGHQLLQLSSEKDALTQQLQSVARSEKEIGEESHDSHVIQDMYQELLTNFSSLQERFTKVISQNAELMDRVQEFEHITIQLEGENSTIAEYIDLYHKRRKDLKEKFMEKDAFITKLLQEREELKTHLNQLQVAAEEYVHTPHSPPADNPNTHYVLREDSMEEPEEEEEDFDEEEESKRKLRAVLENLSGKEISASDHPIMVPCPCCTGEIINL